MNSAGYHLPPNNNKYKKIKLFLKSIRTKKLKNEIKKRKDANSYIIGGIPPPIGGIPPPPPSFDAEMTSSILSIISAASDADFIA